MAHTCTISIILFNLFFYRSLRFVDCMLGKFKEIEFNSFLLIWQVVHMQSYPMNSSFAISSSSSSSSCSISNADNYVSEDEIQRGTTLATWNEYERTKLEKNRGVALEYTQVWRVLNCSKQASKHWVRSSENLMKWNIQWIMAFIQRRRLSCKYVDDKLCRFRIESIFYFLNFIFGDHFCCIALCSRI